MNKVWFKDPVWWDATLDRVFKAMAQALILAIGVDQIGWFQHWYQLLVTVGTMGLLTFLTAVVMDPRDGGSLRLFRQDDDRQ